MINQVNATADQTEMTQNFDGLFWWKSVWRLAKGKNPIEI